MENLIQVTNNMFEIYIKKGEQTYASQNMQAKYSPIETVIITGNSEEFVGQVYFKVDIDVNGEKDYDFSEHIKKINKKEYKIIEEGNNVSIGDLKLLNYSSKIIKS